MTNRPVMQYIFDGKCGGGPNNFFSRVGGDVSPRKYIVATPVAKAVSERWSEAFGFDPQSRTGVNSTTGAVSRSAAVRRPGRCAVVWPGCCREMEKAAEVKQINTRKTIYCIYTSTHINTHTHTHTRTQMYILYTCKYTHRHTFTVKTCTHKHI